MSSYTDLARLPVSVFGSILFHTLSAAAKTFLTFPYEFANSSNFLQNLHKELFEDPKEPPNKKSKT